MRQISSTSRTQSAAQSTTPTMAEDMPKSDAQDPEGGLQATRQVDVVKEWKKLVKFSLNNLVVVSSVGGFLLAGQELFTWTACVGVGLGTALCGWSATVFNQVSERHYDKLMPRTKSRPLVVGTIDLNTAKAAGVAMGVGGVVLLGATTTVTTAALGAFNIVLYANVYTPLKRITRFNTEVGAFVGAVPPIMGWTAAFGSAGLLMPEPWVMAFTLYAWQMHHFMTITWKYRDQYAKGGFVMMSLKDSLGYLTARKGVWYARSLLALPLFCYASNMTSGHFLVTGTLVNVWLLHKYNAFAATCSNVDAHAAMMAGFWQLLALISLMVVHMQDRERIHSFIAPLYALVQNRDYCVYLPLEKEEEKLEAALSEKIDERVASTSKIEG